MYAPRERVIRKHVESRLVARDGEKRAGEPFLNNLLGESMPIKTLDHVNIRTDKIPQTCAFYGELLGLTVTPPPGRSDVSMAAWLCDREQRPVVHIASTEAPYGDGSEGTPAAHGSGAIHHIAFDCSDFEGTQTLLQRQGRDIRTNEIASIGLRQIFVSDPNGITVELNFRSS